MVADPSLGPTLNSMLVSMDKQDHESEEKRSDRPWPTTYCYLHKLSKEWVTEWIVNCTKKEGAPDTLALLNAIDAHDPDAIFKLFFYVTMLKPSDKLARSMLNKLVCSLAFYVRQQEVGRRGALLAAAIAANGVVDWAKLVPYELTFAAERATACKHISSRVEVTIPDHILIDPTYEIDNVLLDFGARSFKLPASYLLADFFPIAGPPHSWANDKKSTQLASCADRATLQIADVSNILNENIHSASSETLHGAQVARKKAQVEKARAARQAKGDTRKRKLTLSLNKAGP